VYVCWQTAQQLLRGEGITLAKETAPRVYVSYSTHTPGQRQRVFALAEQLCAARCVRDGRSSSKNKSKTQISCS
jgi:hypothetical protein